MPSATTTDDELGWSLIDPPRILSCSSPSDGSIGVDFTIDTSTGRRAKTGSYNPAIEKMSWVMGGRTCVTSYVLLIYMGPWAYQPLADHYPVK